VVVTEKDRQVSVKGPLGSRELTLRPEINVEVVDKSIRLKGLGGGPKVPAYLGLTRGLILSMIGGVTKGFTKLLEIKGVGYRIQKTANGMQIFLGFSHPVDFVMPAGITFESRTLPDPDDPKTQMTEITIQGIDAQVVGEVAAEIRRLKPPDVYKGKGVRYKKEYVRKKVGKRGIAVQA
jgi:large subunit ribosomal protein L6